VFPTNQWDWNAWQACPLIRVLVPRERRSGETRVAATPETVKRLSSRGCSVWLERTAGQAAGYSDAAYAEAGAELFDGDSAEAEGLWAAADVLLTVQAPELGGVTLKSGALLLGLLDPFRNSGLMDQLESRQVSALALELLPRISRAQTMDALSSQANIAGYKAVLLAAAALDRFFPMLMTAAGTGGGHGAPPWRHGEGE
jgi:NAD(P) transhydrogenase subunit alpha